MLYYFMNTMGVVAISTVNTIYYQKLTEVQSKLDSTAARAGLNAPLFSSLLAQAVGGADAGTSEVSVTSSAAYDAVIEAASSRYGLDADLIRAVIRVESGYNKSAVSSAGAQGLMQLMPGTANSLGVTDSFDATQNIFAGTQYLAQQLDRFGDIRLALAAYNTGPSRVASYGIADADNASEYAKISPSVRSYVDKVLSYYSAYASV
ncbi:MAG: lytic transglycosylase domain-containing protein [Eubacteriales bacterium]|nr:lytic transglycosylase domain-containing protein [Eubacteriales bacterium]